MRQCTSERSRQWAWGYGCTFSAGLVAVNAACARSAGSAGSAGAATGTTTLNFSAATGTLYLVGYSSTLNGLQPGSYPYKYISAKFTAPASGSYDIGVTAEADTTLWVYAAGTTMNPASPSTNIVDYNDDYDGGVNSKVTVSLTAGPTYQVVTTTYIASATTPDRVYPGMMYVDGTTGGALTPA